MAIAVRHEMAPHISTIQRIDNRILKITLDHPDTHTPLTIIATYAPHQGYSNHEKNNHWEAVHKTLTETPRQHMTMWGGRCKWTARKRKKPARKIRQNNRTIYKQHIPRKRKWSKNGKPLQTTPGDTNEHVEKTKNTPPRKTANKRERYEPGKTRKDIQKQNTITWESPDGETSRQIDYIAISHRYRNAVRKAYAVKGWQANMAQQQHKVIRMDIRLRLTKHYK